MERTFLGPPFGDSDMEPPKVPSPFLKGRGSGFLLTAYFRLKRRCIQSFLRKFKNQTAE